MINNLVQKFLVHSYIYYELNDSLISDEEFDNICRELSEHYDEIEHVHKHLIINTEFGISSGYYIKNYPNIVKSTAQMMLKEKRDE